MVINDDPMMRANGQNIQAEQYAFPYHYIPQLEPQLFLSRHWQFGSSYVAALNLIVDRLRAVTGVRDPSWQHIDIGCGDGALLRYIADLPGIQNAQLTGVDIDERAIKWARLFNPDIRFHCGDLASLEGGYASGSLVEVLEHISPETLPDFVAASAKLLQPSAIMLVTVPSVEKPLAEKHYQHFTFDTIRAVLEPQFEELEIRGFERKETLIKFIQKARINSLARVDSPILNRMLVRRLARLHINQHRCGRIFVTCRRRNT